MRKALWNHETTRAAHVEVLIPRLYNVFTSRTENERIRCVEQAVIEKLDGDGTETL
jgi:hypothetical protein